MQASNFLTSRLLKRKYPESLSESCLSCQKKHGIIIDNNGLPYLPMTMYDDDDRWDKLNREDSGSIFMGSDLSMKRQIIDTTDQHAYHPCLQRSEEQMVLDDEKMTCNQRNSLPERKLAELDDMESTADGFSLSTESIRKAPPPLPQQGCSECSAGKSGHLHHISHRKQIEAPKGFCQI